MDSNSKYAIFCRSFTTLIATIHVCLSPVLHLSHGNAPVIFACFMSIIVPRLLLIIRVRKLIKKENLQANNRILKFLTRNRSITWNDIQFSTDIFLASINLFAVYANIAVRVRTGGSYIYYLVPSSLSLVLFLSFLMDASFVFYNIKYTSKPSTTNEEKNLVKAENSDDQVKISTVNGENSDEIPKPRMSSECSARDQIYESHTTTTEIKNKQKLGHRRIDKQGEVSYKRVPTDALMGSIQLGIANSIGALANTPDRDILSKDFEVIENVAFPSSGSNTTPSHGYSGFHFITYAPNAFRYFRKIFKIEQADFLNSICTQPLTELSNPGASGSIFYVSADDKFIIKTVQHKEAELLRKILPKYYNNLHQNPRTLLPKFFGLFCYQSFGKKNIRLLIMNNLLPNSIKIHEKFDLKGSTYKRFASKVERAKPSPTLKDLDFNEEYKEKNCFIRHEHNMDSNSNYAIFCRSFTTFIATLHVCLSPVLHLSYGYAPVIFACFMSVVVPHLLLTIRVRKLIKKENLQVNNRILKFLTRNRFITWNDIQFSTDIFLASINLFAVYANIAVRVRTGGSYIYYLVPSSLSFLLFLSFLMDASFVFHSMKYTSKPSTISVKTRIDKFMNFLAERLVLVQFPMLILLIIWHNAKLTGYEHYMYDISLLAANFIQYPLIFMMIVFIHGRTVRWAQSRLSKCGMHVYGIQYTMLLIISGLSLSSLVLNLELLHQKFYGVVYFVAPYLTFMVSMTQAFALAGHDAWKNYSYPNEEKNLVKANLAENSDGQITISTVNGENSDGQVTISTINGENSDEREDRVGGMEER